jgi:hypothetical protein
MKGIILGGAILILLGLLAFAVPVFTTEQTKDVAKLGDLKVQTQERQSHVIPPLLSGGVLALGVVLLGVGVLKR